MTLYWWMHWFWITTELYSFVLSADSSIATSADLSITDTTTTATTTTNRPLRRNVKSVDQTSSRVPSQIPIVTTALSKKQINSDPTNDYSNLDSINTTITKCVYTVNINNETISNLTLPYHKNETQLLCNRSIDNLNDTLTKNITDQDVSSSNITSYFLSTKSSLDIENESVTGISRLSIMGIVFGVILFIALISAFSFILYRRSFANKPQTLNDKCSNLDSSGYIDDSSIRDNSEEMYSLDNDSFLNSLEAMTIQNYWTDNLKHTKL